MTNPFTFDADHLIVNEVFSSIQGEGPNVGMPCLFLRLAFCNQHCVWCDTKYTWDWKHYNIVNEAQRYSIKQVIQELEQLNPNLDRPYNLVITGGEPMLQQVALAELVHQLFYRSSSRLDHIEIETAGTVELLPELQHAMNIARGSFNVSPKLATSGNSIQKRRRAAALIKLAWFVQHGHGCFKFVVAHPEDLEEIEWLVNEYDLSPVYLMPEGTDRLVLTQRMEFVAKEAIKRGWYVSPRLHVEIWGNRRGV